MKKLIKLGTEKTGRNLMNEEGLVKLMEKIVYENRSSPLIPDLAKAICNKYSEQEKMSEIMPEKE